jgi:pimeloyl-ACP methyl ester carboxylesterase
VSAKSDEHQLCTIAGMPLEVARRGKGRPILCLHGISGPISGGAFFDALSIHGDVIAPSHPGFGASPLPDWVDSIGDLAYSYLDLLEALDLRDVVLVGLCMGGWIASEIAIRCTQRLSKLILVGSLGAKFSDRETRDIPDIFALHPDVVTGLLWHNKSRMPSPATLNDAELEQIARNQEMAALYLWEPYMHNPKLRRLLSRINIPTLVMRGEHDGLISAAYAKSFCDSIPGARMQSVDDAGHVVEVEQPAMLADHVLRFMKDERRRDV